MRRPRVLPDELTALWTKQLYDEYANIVHWYGVGRELKPTVIAVVAMQPYGRWEPATRTILIADHLIRDHAWRVVLEVLKHEMAHQYVDEVLAPAAPRPHGDAFQDACRRLGVPAWAAAATGQLPAALAGSAPQVLSDEEERLLRRAEKLLALAGSDNEHEAQLAMERAQALFARHNLEALRHRRGAAMTSAIIRLGRRKVFAHEQLIAGLLIEHFFVYVVSFNDYDARDCVEYRAFDVMGTPENVAMAEYVFQFLRRAADELWSRHAAGHDRAHKTSFQRGVINGFSQQLRQTATANAAAASGLAPRTATALIAAGRRRIEETIGKERYPRTVRRASGGGRFDRGSFAAGEDHGRRIVLHKGVGGSGGGGGAGRLLMPKR
ncbi:MAG TPA: DUF2786 domain-containing protein [Polyangia bacterium]|jgi:hypothetical protein